MTGPLIVGIDLGTTHTAVAYADAGSAEAPQIFLLPQLVTASEVEARPLLPSVLYAPLNGEVRNTLSDGEWVVGEFARRRAAEVPGRSVVSAKSWLCQRLVDRNASILPWGKDDSDSPRISPVEASARILQHVRRAWDAVHPHAPLHEQSVVLTVPASFDGVARELTVRAAERAGLHVRLLEEPQAAFYAALARSGSAAIAEILKEVASAQILVCDVGGGTTDLTLIRAARASADEAVHFSRSAVGRHLLLGGDNVDLALAHLCEARLLTPPERLEPGRFSQLVEACRQAKEALLGSAAPEQFAIRLLTGGSALVGGTLRTELTREEVRQLAFESFLPRERVNVAARRRSALVGFGLPYEADPAITHHVAEFLALQLAADEAPRALLFNGGLFRSPLVREHVTEVLRAWFGRTVVTIDNPEPDLAVARGAVAYGLSLLGRGTRIESGAAHGYYLAVADNAGRAAHALCVVPRGAAEGEPHVALSQPLALRVGEPVRFQLYASDHGAAHAAGALVPIDDELSELAPLVTEIAAPDPSARELRVHLEGMLSAVGTVELACVSADSTPAQRFRLAFELKPDSAPAAPRASARPTPSPPNEKLNAALTAIDRVFGKGRGDVKPREVKDLWRELERLFGERATWSGELNRTLYDAVIARAPGRKRSLDHERQFFMLAGYCLRPGFGHAKDGERVQALVPLCEGGLAFPAEARGWQQLFIALRRVAGGMQEAEQTAVRALIAPFLAPEELKLKKSKQFRAQAPDEMWELMSWLERVPAEARAEAGHWLIEQTYRNRDPRLWTWLGRIGARVPAYASAHYAVSRTTVERWLDHLLREKWNEVPSAAGAALKLARVSGDRARDIHEPLRLEVARRLEAVGTPAEQVQSVREYVAVAEAERATWFEELPVGLRLVAAVT